MANIAIYDKFYGSDEYAASDIIGKALECSDHHVIGSADTLRPAVRQIVDFALGVTTERPDIIIMGGMLNGESDYRQRPVNVAEPIMVRRATWWGGVRETAGEHVTYMLPQFEDDGLTYHFPSVVLLGGAPDHAPEKPRSQWEPNKLGMSAMLLSRIAQTYLPEATRLCVSSDPVLSAELSEPSVNRYADDAAEQLQAQIAMFAGEK